MAAVCFICNPKANYGRAASLAAQLRPLVTNHYGAEWRETAYYQHAIKLAQEAAAEGVERIIAMGGDGTVHEVVNGLMALPPEERPAVGIVPVGSGNDFAASLGISPRPLEALQQALEGRPCPTDIARIYDDRGHSEYWTNTLGIGFDAVVNIRTRQVRGALRGLGVYLVAALQTILLNHQPYHLRLETDGQVWEEELLMLTLCNGRRQGGMFWMAPQGSPTDGQIDYVGVRTISRPKMLYTLPFFIRGKHDHLPYTCHGAFRHLILEADRPLYIHTDGEIYAGFDSTIRRLSVESIPGAIRFVHAH
ncbi:MAG: diacylglycerol/lipid kinase family protein [Thermanaerothrix sp.]|uniref:diacylglycerol/lipid kinase family protein n=1 Tax=Thermanaerothrix sp. TaxID=2972675 RepID=UPI003C7CD3B2